MKRQPKKYSIDRNYQMVGVYLKDMREAAGPYGARGLFL